MDVIKGIDQGTPEWHALRRGVITASKFKDVMAKGQGKTRESYLYDLLIERTTDIVQESYTNEYMEWGTECEPLARHEYEISSGVEVEEITFVKQSDTVGCSPDGFVGTDGMLEIKSPASKTQLMRYFKEIGLPPEYKAQVQGQLWICDRDWCDFLSYDPRVPDAARFICTRVFRDDKYILELIKVVSDFTAELLDKEKELTSEGF